MYIRDFFSINLGSALGSLLVLNACGMGGPIREDKSAVGYQLGLLQGPRWVSAPSADSGADAVYNNTETSSVVAIHSLCDRYTDASLSTLMKQLLIPLGERVIISENKRQIDSRESLWTRLKGKLDGVPVESELVVYRKDKCIFDFQIHARDALSNSDEQDFVRFVDGFKYRGAE